MPADAKTTKIEFDVMQKSVESIEIPSNWTDDHTIRAKLVADVLRPMGINLYGLQDDLLSRDRSRVHHAEVNLRLAHTIVQGFIDNLKFFGGGLLALDDYCAQVDIPRKH